MRIGNEKQNQRGTHGAYAGQRDEGDDHGACDDDDEVFPLSLVLLG